MTSVLNSYQLEPGIAIISPAEISAGIQVRPVLPDYRLSEKYVGYYGGRKAFIIPCSDKLGLEVREANALYLLQGLPTVPRLFGYVKEPFDLPKSAAHLDKLVGSSNWITGHDTYAYWQEHKLPGSFPAAPAAPVKRAYGAIVIEAVPGRSLYYSQTPEIYAEIGKQLSGYYRGSLERGLLDPVLESSFLSIFEGQDGRVTVYKVFHGLVQNIRDTGLILTDFLGDTFVAVGEVIPEKFERAMDGLARLIPPINLLREKGIPTESFPYLLAKHFEHRRGGTQGLEGILGLAQSYADGEFDVGNPAFMRLSPAFTSAMAANFLSFLDRFETAMAEYARCVKME